MMKKEVPQINELTGISVDYWNEFFGRHISYIENNDIEGLKLSLKKNPVFTYTNFFPENNYLNVVNSKNIERILELNRIVFIVNSFGIYSKDLSLNELKILFNSAKDLIYG